jgi:hypothetical protein
LYENGQGGLQRNRTKAMELFRLSAAQKIPWPPALQALGSYYWNSGPLVGELFLLLFYDIRVKETTPLQCNTLKKLLRWDMPMDIIGW